MKTLYRRSRIIAAAIVGSMLLAGTALALTMSADHRVRSSTTVDGAQDLGRFVVTPATTRYARPVENLGRIEVRRRGASYVPRLNLAQA